MTFTKEQLQHIIETDHVQYGDASALARMALAGMEAEPVAYMYKDKLHADARFSLYTRFGNWSQEDINEYEITEIPLYAAPQLPQPAVVDIGEIRVGRLPTMNQDEYPGLGDWWVQLRIGEDSEEVLARVYGATPQEANNRAEVLASRAAMLQAGNHNERHLDMVDHSGETNEKVHDQTQFKPVADLYGITSPTGSETSFTFDAVEARDFISGGYSVQEYVELERYQKAVAGNSPVIPDGWVACSERMPDVGDVVLTAKDGFVNVGEMERSGANWRYFTSIASGRELPATHWQPLPAAPQQEDPHQKK